MVAMPYAAAKSCRMNGVSAERATWPRVVGMVVTGASDRLPCRHRRSCAAAAHA